MAILSILTCIGLLLIFFVVEKRKWYDPQVLFVSFWVILIFLASLRLFGLYKITNTTYLIFILGILSFCGGTRIPYLIKTKKQPNKVGEKQKELNYIFLYILYGLVITMLLYNFINVMKLVNSGYTWAKIRRLYVNSDNREGYNEVLKSAFNVVFNSFISTPTLYAALPIAVADILIGKKNKIIFVLTIIMVVLWMFTSGGRSVVTWLALYFVVGLFIIKSVNGLEINRKKILIFGMMSIPLIFVFAFITIQRKGQNMNLIREMYVYFPVGLKNFDYHIQNFHKSGHGYFGGVSSFYGFLYPIFFALKQLHITDYPQFILDAREYSFTLLEPDVDIGLKMNAYATVMYQPYLDGGIVGVVVIMAVFGIACGYIYKKMVETKLAIKYFILYLFFVQKILFSQVRFYFTQVQQAFALIVIILAFLNYQQSYLQRNNKSNTQR